jgi:hypothetical protein
LLPVTKLVRIGSTDRSIPIQILDAWNQVLVVLTCSRVLLVKAFVFYVHRREVSSFPRWPRAVIKLARTAECALARGERRCVNRGGTAFRA